MGMLTLPERRRENRLWQKELFAKNNLNIEGMSIRHVTQNTLNRQATFIEPLPLLNVELLKEIINPAYVEWINQSLGEYRGRLKKNMARFVSKPKMDNLFHTLGISIKPYSQFIRPYCAYLVIKPIETLLERRIS